MRDHGGDLDAAVRRHGGDARDWIDLSTGINRAPCAFVAPPADAWTALPGHGATARLIDAARAAWSVAPEAAILPLAGAQAAIQLVPRLDALTGGPGRARVLGPTYNEHAAALKSAGWRVAQVAAVEALAGAGLAVVVNPNNPDGRRHAPETLMALAARVGRLVVDESFIDATPAFSLVGAAGAPGLIVLRSFGKFYGLAGLRLGFAVGAPDEIAALAELAGPWPVCGPALDIGAAALADAEWRAATVRRLTQDARRLDALAAAAGWSLVGGCALFRLYETPNAAAARDALARHRIWSRIFPFSPRWLRLGPPGAADEWARIEAALAPGG